MSEAELDEKVIPENNLLKYRSRTGLSQKNFGDRCKPRLHTLTINRIEGRIKMPYGSTMNRTIALLRELGIKSDETGELVTLKDVYPNL